MRKSIATATILACGLGVSPTSAQTFGAGIAVESEYVLRGLTLADGFVLQPDVHADLGDSGFTLGARGSFAIEDRERLELADEVDLSATYTRTLDEARELWVTGAYEHYFFLNDAGPDAGGELTLAVGCALHVTENSDVRPAIQVVHDFERFDATYVALEIAPSIPLRPNGSLALTVQGEIGFSDYRRLGRKDFGFHQASLGLELEIYRAPFRITPSLRVSRVDRELSLDQTKLWGGLAVSFN